MSSWASHWKHDFFTNVSVYSLNGKDEGLRERRARDCPLGPQALYARATWGAWVALRSRPAASQIKGVRVASVPWISSQNTWKSWHLFSELPGNSDQCPVVSDVRRQPSCEQQPTDHQLKPVWLPGAINWCRLFPLPGKKEPEGSPGHQPDQSWFSQELLTAHTVSIAAEGCHGNSSLSIFQMRTQYTEPGALENLIVCACSYPQFLEEETKAPWSFNHIVCVHFSIKTTLKQFPQTLWLKATGIFSHSFES